MSSVMVVHPSFDGVWPYAADHFYTLWRAQGDVAFIRLQHGDERPLGEVVPDPSAVRRLVSLGVPSSLECIQRFTALNEATFQGSYGAKLDDESKAVLAAQKVRLYNHPSEGFWSQTVAEYGLALTLCGLRRIPQLHRQIIDDLSLWDYGPPQGRGTPGARGQQFGDNADFTSGTIAGKRVRIVGAGNIASRYASFVHMLGADVAAWDPFATEPSFHRAGSRREWHLNRLVQDAEIFAPMVPLRESTHNLVKAEHIDALPKGCLVVLVTRAMICDMEAVRRRVMADELSLAADVWDQEPLPLGDAFLGRHNVVHTPHNAGRTIDANRTWSEKLAEQFLPV
jgi:phosphoglycerate dehydrogenase-like enzyme